MKKIFLFVLCFGTLKWISAQTVDKFNNRSNVEPLFAPFYHGVASGDPLSDRVIIWTRITLDPAVSPVSVDWEMATDTAFSNIVKSGTATTNQDKDYTIKVDVTGLQPNSWYYYRFKHNDRVSLVGRTRTLPVGDVDSLRFAVASCQDYQNGFYNAYRNIAERNDLDAVIFLGDFIYEYAANSSLGRDHEPDKEIITLSDYRIRHSQYRLDPDLRAAHQQYPWICVWDDHESTNNSWMGGAQNHQPDEGDWEERKAISAQVYAEWIPIRLPEPGNNLKIYRRFTFGDLLDLNMIDTRLIGRDEQLSNFISINNPDLNNPDRNLIGTEQLTWLTSNFSGSNARWQILGQQVMMMPLLLNVPLVGSQIINSDQWDGYPAERRRVYDYIMNNNIQNVVVLTGDIHTAWSGDLPYDNYDPATGANSVGVEFVCASITSQNAVNIPGGSSIIQAVNPHIKYVNLVEHGYFILDVNKQRTQADHIFVNQITSQGNFTTFFGNSFFTNAGERFLRPASGPVTGVKKYPTLAPFLPKNPELSVNEASFNKPIALSAYPNPFVSQLVIQYYMETAADVVIELLDMSGRTVFSKNMGQSLQGLNYAHFDGTNLNKGTYVLIIKAAGFEKSSQTLIKIE